jgi:ketosteroid isomerase-like protein
MFTGPIEDRLAIQELGGWYGDVVHRRDKAAFADLWTQDSQWYHPAMGTLTGRDVIVSTFSSLADALETIHFMAMLAALSIEGDRARGTTYVTELLIQKDGTKARLYGRYDDEYVNASGRWRYSRRSYALLHQD